MSQVDVAILGGGLAGSLLARQLRRQVPDASVVVFERREPTSFKVGESTVEIAANYLIRRLGLSMYLYDQHLPKNGLRFFFDTEGCDAELTQMSELGVSALPPYPSFQLDRARFERDLIQLNREAGVDVRVGARVEHLELGDDGPAPHRIVVRDDEGDTSWQARWVVDATGRSALVGRERDLHGPEPAHPIAAAWGRFRGVGDMDDIDAPEWRSRVNHTCRALSTNHFCYPGYWIWFIPLGRGVTSVGVVCETERWDKGCQRADGFLTFLRKHRAVADLLEGAELVDHKALRQLAFRGRTFFDPGRWAAVGDAAAFTDPFYSPGSDFIAIENDMVTDLVARERAGEGIEERLRLYERYMHYRYDITLALYQDLYPTFGSYELFRAKAFFDTGCYYNLLFDSYLRDGHLDPRALRNTLRRSASNIEVTRHFGKLFRNAADEMMRRGTYYRGNVGRHHTDGRAVFGLPERVGVRRSRREVNQRNMEIFERTKQLLDEALDGRASELDAAGQERELFDAWSRIERQQPA